MVEVGVCNEDGALKAAALGAAPGVQHNIELRQNDAGFLQGGALVRSCAINRRCQSCICFEQCSDD